jgi:hypothetical protein
VATYFILIAGFSIMTAVFALFVAHRYEFNTAQTGYVFAMLGVIGVVIQGGLIGRLVKKFGEARLATAGALILTASLFAMPFTASIPMLLLACAGIATGNSLLSPTLSGIASRNVDAEWQGRALGILQSAGSLARWIGPVLGGWLRVGIPEYRLPRDILEKEINHILSLGVEAKTNTPLGKELNVDSLKNQGFKAIFLGTGAGTPHFMGIPGEGLNGVYSANEFLTRVNLMGGDKFPYLDTPVTLGKSVVVIGAGNTAMDCLRVAKRLGIPTVRCVYRRSEAEAPARIEELRHAKEEGIEFFFLHGPVEILTSDDGNVRGNRGDPTARAGLISTRSSRCIHR